MIGSLSNPLKFALHLLILIVMCKGSQENKFLIKNCRAGKENYYYFTGNFFFISKENEA